MDEYSAGMSFVILPAVLNVITGTWELCVMDAVNNTNTGVISSYSLAVDGRPVESYSTSVVLDSVVPANPYANHLRSF